MSSQESMDLGRKRGSAPKAGSVWESRMKIDEVKGGIKVFNATDENSAENTQSSSSSPNREIEISNTNHSPIGKRKTWKSESLDGSPVKIAALRSELSDGIKRSPISIKKSSLKKVKDDDKNEGKAKAGGVDERVENSVVDDDEREKKSRSDEDCEEIKATISSNVAQVHGEDELDFDQDKEIQVKEIGVNDHNPKRIVIEEKKLVRTNQKPVPISPILKKHPLPAVHHQTNTSKCHFLILIKSPSPSLSLIICFPFQDSDNIQRVPRTSSKLQSFGEFFFSQLFRVCVFSSFLKLDNDSPPYWLVAIS